MSLLAVSIACFSTMIGAPAKSTFSVEVTTNYSEAGIPQSIRQTTLLESASNRYLRIVSDGRALLVHVDRANGAAKVSVDDGATVLSGKLRSVPNSGDSLPEARPQAGAPHLTISGIDCVQVKEIAGEVETVSWVNAKNHGDMVAYYISVDGKVKTSSVRLQKRIGLKSDLGAFTMPTGAKTVQVNSDVLSRTVQGFFANTGK